MIIYSDKGLMLKKGSFRTLYSGQESNAVIEIVCLIHVRTNEEVNIVIVFVLKFIGQTTEFTGTNIRLLSIHFQLSIVNLTNILELTRAFVNKATNFTNKELFFNYLSLWFKSGALLLNPVNHSNDMVALNFSQVRILAFRTI